MNQQTDCSSVTFSLDDLVVNSDDLLPPFLKLEKYSSSDAVLHRTIAARDVLETLRSVITNEKEVDCIFRVFHTLAEDYEPCVRMEIMERIPQMAILCKESISKADDLIFQHLLPVIMKYLTDISNQVRKTGHSSLLYMIEQDLIGKNALEEKVIPLVLQLTETSHIDDYRTEAVSLLSRISSLVGKDVTERMLVSPFTSLCHDSSFHVRKICAESFGEICSVVETEITEHILLPEFTLLCSDSVYGVRKACAEAFTAVSCVCSMEARHKELAAMFLNLLCDQSRWVRVAAFQSLGPFISTFAKPGKTGLYCDKDGLLTVVDVPNGIHTPSKVGFPSCELIKSICDNNGIIKAEKLASKSTICDKVQYDSATKNEDLKVGDVDFSGSSKTVIEVNGLADSDETLPAENSGDIVPITQTDSNSDGCDSLPSSSEFSSDECQCDQVCSSEPMPSTEEDHVNADTGANILFVENVYSNQHSSSVLNGDTYCNSSDFQSNNGDTYCNSSDFHSDNGDNESTNHFIVSKESVNGGDELCEIGEICDNHELSHNHTACTNWPSIGNCDTLNAIISHDFCEEEISEENYDQQSYAENVKDESSSKTDSENGAFNSFQYWQLPLPEVEVELLIEEIRSEKYVCDEAESLKSSVLEDFTGVSSNDNNCLTATGLLNMNQTLQNYIDSQQKSLGNQLENILMEDSKKICYENILSVLRKCDFVDLISVQSSPMKHALSPLDQDIVPPELLLLYLSMTNFTKPPRADAEMARHCAYSLPAVALTLGRRFWPCLKQTYNTLASDMQGFIMQWKVRRTLASSMHKLAVILGPDIAARDLLPIFSGFIRDLDEVRIGILQHLSDFLEVLRPKERKEYLPRLSEFLNTDNDRNWRFRHCLAQQLIPIAQLYEPVEVRQYLIPLALSLLQDKVAEVRIAAVRVVAVMVKRMNEAGDSSLTKELFLTELDLFVFSRKWLHRQTYVYLCQEFVKENSLLSSDQFSEVIMPQLLYLCWDQVANVRLAVARCLALFVWPSADYSDHSSPHRELLLQAIHALQEDVDNDVKHFANIVATDECSCLLHGEEQAEIKSTPESKE